MKIVIETGVIGLARLFETARTGIHRVISSLALELLAFEELDISFTALSSLQVNGLTDGYFSERGLGERAFPRSGFERLLLGAAYKGAGNVQDSLVRKILSRLYRMSLSRRIGKAADIFHSLYAPLPRFRPGCPPVRMLTVHDIIPLIHPEYFAEGFVDEFRPIVESFSPARDFLFTISECSKRDICTYFNMDPERVFVIPLAAAPDIFHHEEDLERREAIRKKYRIPEGRYLLTLATVEKRKNLDTAVAAFRAILEEPDCGDLSFVLVGTRGWKVREVIERIESDPVLRERIVFTGFVPDEELSALYSGAEMFLYLSLYEGFGLPPLEAMQCGVPVVASGTSSLPEVVGDAGILVDPLDRDAVSGAMLRMLRDEGLREEYRGKGLARSERFTWQRSAEVTAAGYRTAWENR
ncbi:MAG: hypothetical protein Kow0089_19820 [Desulfobulbaceae bacterium]